jgi:hypothetical protein
MGKIKKKITKKFDNIDNEKKENFNFEPVKKTEEQWKAYVEWATGGPNGGTCQRPDIVLYQTCDPCELVKYCLCSSKTLAKRR